MSGVWTERSIPMTDHECAVEALEEVGATILARNQNQIRIRINGQEWSMQRSHGRYSIRVNRRVGNSLNWMNNVGPVYEQAVQGNSDDFVLKKKPRNWKANVQRFKHKEKRLRINDLSLLNKENRRFLKKPKH